MRISFTRLSIAPVVALQWIAAIVLIVIGGKNEGIFKDFNVALPVMSVIALQATRTMVLVPIAVISTAIIVIAEVVLQSEVRRLVVQMVVSFVWFAFACFCLVALELGAYTIVEKLR
jgi:hypothetical protein